MGQMKLSIIIPYYREPYLDRTIQSVRENTTNVEILPEDGRNGMRSAINSGLAKAGGDYVMKLDAHCIVCKDFDRIAEDCQENWFMAPRRYSLHEETWTRDEEWPIRDYHYLTFPGTADTTYGHSLQVANWPKTGEAEIDDTMTIQGSCWVANRKYFMEHVGYLDDRPETYGTMAQEQQEECLKYWLGGGEVKVNKKYWYAHLQKRGYHYKKGVFSHRNKKNAQTIYSNEWGTKHWMNNEEPGMIHKFEWLVDKFWPLPDWPENWREQWPQT